MGRQKTIALIILCILAPIVIGVWFLIPSEKDASQYHELVDLSQSARSAKKKSYVATQYREGVIKDIYYQHDHNPVKARVSSDRSQLVFDQQNEGMEILEHMEQLVCVMQKELFYVTDEGNEILLDQEGFFKDRKGKRVSVGEREPYPMQVVRYVTADTAKYYYNKERIVANQPTITEYRAEGHELPAIEDPLSLIMDGTTIKSDSMKLSFQRGQLGGKPADGIVAEGNVVIDHRNVFTAKGQRLEFVAGTMILSPNEEESYCTISNDAGVLIKTSKVLYTPETGDVILLEPHGKMKLDMVGANHLNFQAKLMLWNNILEEVTLIDDVKIEVPEVAKLSNDDRVTLAFNRHSSSQVKQLVTSPQTQEDNFFTNKEMSLQQLLGSGKSTIELYNSEGDVYFITEGSGVTSLDIEKRRVEFTSYLGQEFHCYDRFGHVFAKDLVIDLSSGSKIFSPEKVFLNGDVKLLTGVIVLEGEVTGATQYVLADTLELDPQSKTVVMECSGHRRVLFFDRMNHLQMSAPKLVMRKAPGMERPTVKGVGDVRFRLMEKELEQIKKRFSFHEEEQKS
ncbi:MAG: hypothetical protein AAGG81_03055 [Chlamydiota bacterium]